MDPSSSSRRSRPSRRTGWRPSRTGSRLGFAMVSLSAWVNCAHPAPESRQAAVVAAPGAAPAAAPQALALVPAEVARTGLIASFVVPALERSLERGVALVRRATPLPLDAKGVRDMLLAQAGLPPEVATHLDLTAPIAGAGVVAGAGRASLTAFSFAGRSAADIQALFTALGRTVARRGAAVEIENATGDHGWFLPQGNVVVFADSDEALVRAGSLALEARRRAEDDVSVVFYPDTMARAGGTDVKTALARFMSEIEERSAAGGSRLGGEGLRQLREIAGYLQDVATAELALNLDEAAGVRLLARLHPRPSSKLEGIARETRSVAIDPVLIAGGQTGKDAGKDETGVLFSSVYGAGTLEALARYRARIPGDGGKGALAAGRLLDALRDGLTGSFVVAGRARSTFSAEVIYPVRDDAAATKIDEALAGQDKDALSALVNALTQGEGISFKVKRVAKERLGKLRALHATLAPLAPKDKDRGTNAILGKLVGPAGLDVFVAVLPGTRVAVMMGSGAKARLAALATGKPAAGTPPLAGAAAKAGSRSAFFALDLRQVLAQLANGSADPRLRVLGSAVTVPMPVFGGSSGDGKGQTLTLDLTIPPDCFTGIGVLVQAAMMRRD